MTAPDPYEILGVPRNASAAQIKDSYHKLALQYHPDVAPAQQAFRFSEIAGAYDVLRDSAKRARYDQDQTAHDPSCTVADDAGSRAADSAFKTAGRSGYRPATRPPTAPSPFSPMRPPSRAAAPYRPRRPHRPVSSRPVWPRRIVAWCTVLLSLLLVILGLALAYHLTRPAGAAHRAAPAGTACDPPVSGNVLAPPPGKATIAWEGQVTLSSQCYLAVDGPGGPAGVRLPADGSIPDGLVLAASGGSYSISFGDKEGSAAGQPLAVRYIGVQTLNAVPARDACLTMAREAPATAFTAPGTSVCVLTNGGHVLYLKITGLHADRGHQVQWITADMIEWQETAT